MSMTRWALSGALVLILGTPVLAMGTQPPDEPAAAACPAGKKCPPDAHKQKGTNPAKADCKEADKSKCKAKQSFNERYDAAVARFLCCERSLWQATAMPVGMCVRRTAESVVLMCWPPEPDAR